MIDPEMVELSIAGFRKKLPISRAAVRNAINQWPLRRLSLTKYRSLSALVGFTAVLCGAFGAHALHGKLEGLGTLQAWQTGALYHLTNATVLLVLSSSKRMPRVSYWLFFVSTVLFSGSLYLFALTSLRWLAFVTPFGGLGMLLGWLSLGFGPAAKQD